MAERSRGWLRFWQDDIGRALLFLVPWRDRSLLVTQRPDELDDANVKRPAVYCPRLRPGESLAGIL